MFFLFLYFVFFCVFFFFFFFQAEDGIRDGHLTGVQTCALLRAGHGARRSRRRRRQGREPAGRRAAAHVGIGRASWREGGEVDGGVGAVKRKLVAKNTEKLIVRGQCDVQ